MDDVILIDDSDDSDEVQVLQVITPPTKRLRQQNSPVQIASTSNLDQLIAFATADDICPTRFSFLCRCLACVIHTKKRSRINQVLSFMFCRVLAVDPTSLLPTLLLAFCRFANESDNVSIGVGGGTLIKLIKQIYGITSRRLSSAFSSSGDIGTSAMAFTAQQTTLRTKTPLTSHQVFNSLFSLSTSAIPKLSTSERDSVLKNLITSAMQTSALPSKESGYQEFDILFMCRLFEGDLRLGASHSTLVRALGSAVVLCLHSFAKCSLQKSYHINATTSWVQHQDLSERFLSILAHGFTVEASDYTLTELCRRTGAALLNCYRQSPDVYLLCRLVTELIAASRPQSTLNCLLALEDFCSVRFGVAARPMLGVVCSSIPSWQGESRRKVKIPATTEDPASDASDDDDSDDEIASQDSSVIIIDDDNVAEDQLTPAQRALSTVYFHYDRLHSNCGGLMNSKHIAQLSTEALQMCILLCCDFICDDVSHNRQALDQLQDSELESARLLIDFLRSDDEIFCGRLGGYPHESLVDVLCSFGVATFPAVVQARLNLLFDSVLAEWKLDGMRCQAHVSVGTDTNHRLFSRNLKDISDRFPELPSLLRSRHLDRFNRTHSLALRLGNRFGHEKLVLDGEMVANSIAVEDGVCHVKQLPFVALMTSQSSSASTPAMEAKAKSQSQKPITAFFKSKASGAVMTSPAENIAQSPSMIPVNTPTQFHSYYIFDVLFIDSDTLLHIPLGLRRLLLVHMFPSLRSMVFDVRSQQQSDQSISQMMRLLIPPALTLHKLVEWRCPSSLTSIAVSRNP